MTQHILFEAAGLKLALPASSVVAIHEQLPVQEVSGTQAWFIGLAVANGRLLPVTDLGAFLGDQPCHGRTLELGQHVALAALRVDSVAGLSDAQPVYSSLDRSRMATTVNNLKLTGKSVGTGDEIHQVVDVDALVKSAAFVNIKELS